MQPPQFECEHLISDPESFKDGVAALADHLPPRLSRLKLDLGSCAIGDSGVALLQCFVAVHNEACRLSRLIPICQAEILASKLPPRLSRLSLQLGATDIADRPLLGRNIPYCTLAQRVVGLASGRDSHSSSLHQCRLKSS